MRKKSLTLNQLIKLIDLKATLNKRLDFKILDVADLFLAKKNTISFFSNINYFSTLLNTLCVRKIRNHQSLYFQNLQGYAIQKL